MREGSKKNVPKNIFRGNLMFASDRQIKIFKPSRVCDLLSLMYVVYFFVEDGLPWTDYIDLIMTKDRRKNLYEPENFK
jgi:hypothetical protein